MRPAEVRAPTEEFLAAADAAADARPEVDRELARELFAEAARLLHDGLALDGLDEHDRAAVVAGLGADLASVDPGAAVRRRAQEAVATPGGLHDPEAVAASCLMAVTILQI